MLGKHDPRMQELCDRLEDIHARLDEMVRRLEMLDDRLQLAEDRPLENWSGDHRAAHAPGGLPARR